MEAMITLDDIPSLPMQLVRQIAYISGDGRIVCPTCGEDEVQRRAWSACKVTAQWQCSQGHWFKMPTSIRTRKIVIVSE